MNPNPVPAENVIYYDRDQDIIDAEAGPFGLTTGNFGSGNWDLPGYWAGAHGTALPVELANATRYQTHLFELGVTYVQNGNQTLFPPPATLPAGFTTVTPAVEDIPVATGGEDPLDENLDGQPDLPGVPSIDPKRRVITAAVGTCEGQDFSQPIPIDSRFIELFVTERSDSSLIFGEIIGPITPQNSDDIVTNVQLVE